MCVNMEQTGDKEGIKEKRRLKAGIFRNHEK